MRILLIEDNPTIADEVRVMLERQRFAVRVAHDGEAGLDALLENTFDAVVIDLVLPTRDGFSICKTARAEGIQTLPIRTNLVVGDLVVDGAGRCVMCQGKQIRLAATEYRLLEYLARNAEVVLSRDQIIDSVWGEDFDGNRNIVDVYVSAIRRKLTKARVKARIATVWGTGYKMTA